MGSLSPTQRSPCVVIYSLRTVENTEWTKSPSACSNSFKYSNRKANKFWTGRLHVIWGRFYHSVPDWRMKSRIRITVSFNDASAKMITLRNRCFMILTPTLYSQCSKLRRSIKACVSTHRLSPSSCDSEYSLKNGRFMRDRDMSRIVKPTK